MTLSRLNKILEIFWWVVAGITLLIVVLMIVIEGWDKWGIYLLAPIVAILAALLRRFAAKRLAKSEAEQTQRAKKA
ncbi:MAG: hypothetical protein IPO32_10260 [Crocinitomicaceae bacterium]|jgi:membrane protein implicated in regulation of membrane protease activity|nr:hypothetical protein [Crocinitomicaceae bacterium]MBK6953191.1 hypothetical protein [Crocinitomicaceae bacterium]MBK9591861.1 hypothetical protein [Crocinitomicaceae bacterium]